MNILRIMSILAVIVLPIAGSGMLTVVIIIACARTAYMGTRASVVYDMFGALLCVELIYGVPLGTISFAYLAAAMILGILQRFLVLPPWPSGERGTVGDAVRVTLIALGLLVLVESIGRVLDRLV